MPSDTDMRLGGSLEWVTAYGKMQCRSLFWRVRAAVKKAVKNAGKHSSSSSMILLVMLSILMMAVAIWERVLL